MEMALKTNIVQVTNVAPVATVEQMSTLFGFLGKIVDIKLYPSDDYIFQPTSRVCYIHFADSWSVGVAQHLTNTVFIDRALIVVPIAEERYARLTDPLDPLIFTDTIPDETKAMALTSPSASVPSLIANSPVINQVTGVGASQVIQTMDPRLSALGLPQYPPLPANMDPLKVEEIRRTVYVGNLDSTLTAEKLLKFFNQIGEVKYVRMAGDETQPTRFAFVEFTDQTSVASALQYNGVIYGGRPLKINHSNNAIVKPQAKSSEAAQREIEEAMKRVREAQSLITAAIEPELVEKKSDRSRSRSRSRRRSGSRSRKRSRSRSHSRKRSRRRSNSRQRSRSRRHRSRSRDHKSRSRSKDRKKRSVSPARSRREKSRSRSSERSKKRHRKSRSRSRSKSSTRSKTSVSSKSKDSHKSDKKSKDKTTKEKSPKKEKSIKKELEKEIKVKVEPQPEEKPSTPKVAGDTTNEELGPPILTPEIPFKDPNNFVKLEVEDSTEKMELEKRLPPSSEIPETADSADDTKEETDVLRDDKVAIRSPAKDTEFKAAEPDVDLRMLKPVEKVIKKEKERSSSPRHKSRSPSRAPSRASRSPSYRSRSVTKRHSRSPSKRRSRSPVKKWSRSPSKRRSKSPVKKRSRSPIRRGSRTPSKRGSRSPSKRPSRSPSRKRSRSRSRKRSRTPTKLSRRRISPSPSPIRRRSRSPVRRRRSRSNSRVYPRKRRISRSPRRRSRTPRRRSRSPSYRRRSRSPRRSRTPVRRRRSPSITTRTSRLSRSPKRRSRSPRRRSRTRSRSGSTKRDSRYVKIPRHKKRKDKDRDHSRDRKKKRRDEEKERSGSTSKDMKVVRNYDEEEKGYDSSHDVESKRSSSISKPREEDPPKPPVDSDASDRRSGDMDLDSD